MKLLVLCLALLPSLALAQVAPADTAANPEPKTPMLTYLQIVNLNQGLANLDGYQKIITEGGKDRTVAVAYKLSFKTRAAISHDQVVLQPIIDIGRKEMQAFAKSLGSDLHDESANGHREAQQVYLDFVNAEGEKKFDVVDLTRLNLTELDGDDNVQITASTLTLLAPILDQK